MPKSNETKNKAGSDVADAAKDLKVDIIDAMDQAKEEIYFMLYYDIFQRFKKLPDEYYDVDDAWEPKAEETARDDPNTKHWFNAIPLKGDNLTSWDSGFVKKPSKSGYQAFLDFTVTKFAGENLIFYTACPASWKPSRMLTNMTNMCTSISLSILPKSFWRTQNKWTHRTHSTIPRAPSTSSTN